MLSYASFLREHARSSRVQRRPAKMYKRDGVCLDAQIQLAEHIVVSLNAEMGDQNAAALLESWGTKKRFSAQWSESRWTG